MLLLKRGGSVIYNGPLGKQSREMITYFESLPGVDPIGEDYSAHLPHAVLQNPDLDSVPNSDPDCDPDLDSDPCPTSNLHPTT